MLEISAFLRFYHYVKRQIEHDSSLVEIYRRAVAAWIYVGHNSRGLFSNSGYLKIVEALFK
jgi:hypothetical protein